MKTRATRWALLGTIAILYSTPASVVAADPAGCALLVPESDAKPSSSCISCHGGAQGSHSHPVDVDYGNAARSSRSGLRSPEEVVKRGLMLPDGKVSCTTCHDRRSQWKYHLVVPPGAAVRPAVVAGDESTYDPRAVVVPPLPGADVGRKPLCLACHAFD